MRDRKADNGWVGKFPFVLNPKVTEVTMQSETERAVHSRGSSGSIRL